ncbi:MAG TPA: metallophosphoesterase [Rubrobacter sp.]|nr:metallophosphoesterase [Rubrobacter sp.]
MQGVTAYSAVICWVSQHPGSSVVEYGKTPELGRKETDPRVRRRHVVALAGLDPCSTYHYRVGGVGESSSKGSLRTAPVGEDSHFRFAVVGDSGSGGKGQLAVAALLGCLEPDLVLHTGDVVYPAGQQRHYDRRFFAPYRNLIKTVPVFPVLGNHDVMRGDGTAFLENFHPTLESPRSTKRYYSFDWGNTHFVALDSELYHSDRGSDPERQKDFLEQDLAASRKRWKVAFLHRSPYGSSRHGGDGRVREDLEPLFARHAVDLVFSGHDHVYERTVPIRGVTYVVSGGGGRRLYPAGNGEFTASSVSAHHAVLVRVSGRRLSLEAVEVGGKVVDRLELLKHTSQEP